MGGSWISTGAEASRFARFAFRRHFFQHLGFRLVRSCEATPARLCDTEVFVLGAGVSDNPITTAGVEEKCMHKSTNSQFQYETKEELDFQLRMEYGKLETNAAALVEFVEATVAKENVSKGSALVLGSAAGLSSFLLTKTFQKVVGVEYSGRFINAAMEIQSGKRVEFGEGQVACLPSTQGVDPARVTFKQMTWVPNELEGFNCIVVEFLDRLSEPRGWLIKLWEVLEPQGVLVIVAPKQEQREDAVKRHLKKWFDLIEKAAVGDVMVTVWKFNN